MSKTIYLSGAIAGLPEDQVLQKFQKTKCDLIEQGSLVYMPIGQVWCNCLKDDPEQLQTRNRVQMLMNCDTLYLFPDWSTCKTATLERDIAMRIGMNLFYL